jgi:hypothetical protein
VDFWVFLSGIHPDDRARVEAAIAACTDPAGDGVYHIEFRVIGIETGVERWVSTHGQTFFEERRPVAFIGAVLDITKRKRADEHERSLRIDWEESGVPVSLGQDAQPSHRGWGRELIEQALPYQMGGQDHLRAAFGWVALHHYPTCHTAARCWSAILTTGRPIVVSAASRSTM